MKRELQIILKLAPRILAYREFRKKILADEKLDQMEMEEEAKKLTDAIISLGPTFIKFGQVLSVRPDIMPEPYIRQLSRLQDEVPPASFEEVREILEKDLGTQFKVLDKVPISSASLGQVYLGESKEGKKVAIKVVRPNVDKVVSNDIKIMKRLLPLLRFVLDKTFVDLMKTFVDEFSTRIFDEMDYNKEANNLRNIKEALKEYPGVKVPSLIKSTKHILVMEYVPSEKVTSTEVLSKYDRRSLSYKVFKVFMNLLLNNDYFHADPHPGNVGVNEEGELVIYDFGMVGRVDAKTRNILVRAYYALTSFDADTLVSVMDDLGAIDPYADREILAQGIDLFMQNLQGIEVDQMEVEDFLDISNQVFYKFPLRLPYKLVLPLRMISVLEGTCRNIYPDFNFLEFSERLLDEEGYKTKVILEQGREVLQNIRKKIMDSLLGKKKKPIIPARKEKRSYLPQILIISAIIVYIITGNDILSILLALFGLSFIRF